MLFSRMQARPMLKGSIITVATQRHLAGIGRTAAPAIARQAERHSAQLHMYGGRCTTCNSQHWLPCTPEAAQQARLLVQTIHKHGRLDFESPQADPRFSIDYLYTKGPGRMIGVLVALDKQGHTHVLKAFSGQITECWHIPGWVGPVAGIINTSPAYVRTRRTIEKMSTRLQQLQAALGSRQQNKHACKQQQQRDRDSTGPLELYNSRVVDSSASLEFMLQQQQRLKRRRKRLSHHLLQQIQHSYHTANVAQQNISLLDVYLRYVEQYEPQLPVTKAGGFVGMPAGTGDCCAPKLLHAAASAELMPVGLAEVWCGSAPGTATKAKMGRPLPVGGLDPDSSRLHMEFYGMCDKCSALLGTMLCGLS